MDTLRASATLLPLVSSFFLAIGPPPRSTLFPYTTLFRSDLDGAPCCGLDPSGITHMLKSPRLNGLDRKSTRLNSSHTVISYAVFCLKKKKGRSTHRRISSPAGGSSLSGWPSRNLSYSAPT